MVWRVETLNDAVDREFDALPADIRARFARTCQLIATVGLEQMGTPHVRHVTGPLWEMRLAGRDGIARALYVAAAERRVVVVRVFVKKTRRTPSREIETALRRAREVLR
ncbi:MAG: type II toxin-antitoxin system RelE/ParE family toxin [Acidobacteriia bacterium]|nr:type II toxin-antitoxin system RelE/ParE family toxin [Terriglobia bacterium]